MIWLSLCVPFADSNITMFAELINIRENIWWPTGNSFQDTPFDTSFISKLTNVFCLK